MSQVLTPADIQAIAEEVAKLLSPLMTATVQELDANQVAELLQVSKPTIERWTKQKLIPSYLVGRRRRYDRDAVLAAARSERSGSALAGTESRFALVD